MDKKERLGEFYIDFSDENIRKQRKVIVNTINKFINQYKTFSPINETGRKTNRKFIEYASSHEMKILDINYFSRKISNVLIDYNSYIHGRKNDICIMRDKLGVNHIMLIRNNSYFPKEMSSLLGIETLKEIYKSFVYEIENLKGNLRFIKELNNFINEKILNKNVLLIKGSSVYNYYFTNVKFDAKDFIIRTKFIKSIYHFNDEPIQYENTDSYDGIDKICRFCGDYITNADAILENKEDICDFLAKAYEKFNEKALSYLDKAIANVKCNEI